MNRKERERLVIFNQIKVGLMDRRGGAQVLRLSLRQVHRLYVHWRKEGDAGLVHRSRGRESPRRWEESERDRALALYREHYRGFGPTLWSEKLGESHGIWASHDTARRWLKEAGLLEKARRGRRCRRRRERKGRFGQMVQMDGSPHDWFEGRGPECALMTVIDDATGRRRGWFFEAETLVAAMKTFGSWCECFGVPESLYVDRYGIYRADCDPTAEELEAGKRPVTQFGRAMEELNVEVILALSPQAKGRIERSNGVMQDRLVKEMRLAGICGIEQANQWLGESGFWASMDEKFSVEAAEAIDGHRPLVVRLADVLCIEEKRTVGLDGRVQWAGRILQLEEPTSLRGVEVWQRLDGAVEILGGGKRLAWREITAAARKQNQAAAKKAKRGPIRNNKIHKPTRKQQLILNLKKGMSSTQSTLRKAG